VSATKTLIKLAIKKSDQNPKLSLEGFFQTFL